MCLAEPEPESHFPASQQTLYCLVGRGKKTACKFLEDMPMSSCREHWGSSYKFPMFKMVMGSRLKILYIGDKLTCSRKEGPQSTLTQSSIRFWLGKGRPSKERDLLTQW